VLTRLRRLSQTQWVVVATILGVAVGLLFPDSKAAEFDATWRAHR
jgi:Na+/H+-dicarboxylate symporter